MDKIGIALSVVWLSIIGLLVCLKWESLNLLSLNEWGDFLAGATAPLAFLWLIIGYNLQRKELKANTEALQSQRDEMANQAQELANQTQHLASSARAAHKQADNSHPDNAQKRLDL